MTYQTKDSAFFTVESKDVADQAIIQRDVISLSITEEMDKMPTGSIQLYDPNQIYSRLLRHGAELTISWGYRKTGAPLAFGDAALATTYTRAMERKGLRVRIMNPAGSSGSNGVSTFTCNFLALLFRGAFEQKTYDRGTYRDIVVVVMARMGISVTDVDFALGGKAVTGETAVVQEETDFQFLVRLASRCNAFFRVGFMADGTTVGVFVDFGKIATSVGIKFIEQGNGALTELSYKTSGRPNVIEYSWQNHEGENGTGDNVRLDYVNGQPVFTRYTAAGETVQAWQLNPAKIKAEFDRRQAEAAPGKGLASATDLMLEVMQAKNFEEVKRFFDPVTLETAPNGLGYSINGRMIGDTRITAGTRVFFGEGFPDMMTGGGKNTIGMAGNPLPQAQRKTPIAFYMRQVTHEIGAGGYFTTFEAVDAYTISPTGVLYGSVYS